MNVIDDIISLFNRRGGSQYGHEAVTQLEHALQSAQLATADGATPILIAASLLHDIGHLLHELPDDAPDQGIDDHHENSAFHYLKKHFQTGVAEITGLHVAAKRYLVTVEPSYRKTLSEPSIVSLGLQGGPMSERERRAFEANPFHAEAVQLRRYDDAAKVPDRIVPPIEAYREMLMDLHKAVNPSIQS
jgi:[1-hydroxy-2-(trimethylamino)ethyl]phosphonate dioxygenase